MSGLTEDQKRKIEENRQKAIAKRIEKQSPVKNNSTQPALGVNSNCYNSVPPSHLQTAQNNSVSVSNKNNYINPSKVTTAIKATHSQLGNAPSTSKWAKTGSSRSSVSTSAPQHCALSNDKHFNSGPNLRGKCVFVGDGIFTVEIGYSAPLVQFFKELQTRRYDQSTKFWSFKLEEYDTFIKGVHNFRPDIEIEGLPRWILQIFKTHKVDDVDVVPSADLSGVDEKLVQALLPFQREGVNCAIHHNGRLLIADDMGLGKTLQAICVACYYRQEWPLLIVAPSSVRYDWAQQICRWLPSVAPCDINVVETGKASATSGIINIISYDLLSKKTEDLKKKMFKVIIMDESHFLKNTKTVRTKAAMPLLKSARRVLLLSGTPALSRPVELFSQITAVCPDLFRFHEFGLRYCNAKQMQWGWDYSSSSNMVELQALLEKKIMIRRQKIDVLSQLPSKYRQVIMLDPSSIHKNKDLKAASKTLSNGNLKGMSKRGALLQYFHETCKSKLTAVRDYILDLVEAEKKFLVFAHHKEMLDCIEDGIKSKTNHIEYIRIDGRTTSEQRCFLCSKFQSCDNYKVAILSITAANAGLNLAAANIVVFAELFWNPGILVQAEDRAHRIGQKDSVSIQYLVAQHTADDYIWPLVQSKLDTLSKAGLAKDDFADTDTKRLTDSTQQNLLDMFSTEFIDDTVPDVPETDKGVTPDIDVNVQGVSPEKVDVNVVSVSPLSVKINVVAEKTKNPALPKTPRKSAPGDWTRKIPSKQALLTSPTSLGATQQEKTPSKRQASITSFFDRSPVKKLRLDDGESLATQHTEACESKHNNNHSDNADMTIRHENISEGINSKNVDVADNDTQDPNDIVYVEECDVNMTVQNPSDDAVTWPDDDDDDELLTQCRIIDEGLASPVTSDESPIKVSQESKSGKSSCVTSQESGKSDCTQPAAQTELLWLQDLDWDDELQNA